ncbi:MAG: pilus assembly protein TadG-related protein [Aeromicrobium sp.]
MNDRERGSVTVMTIGFLVFIGLLAVVVINTSAAFLERQRLDNLADGAALAAADGLSRDTFYRRGEVTLDDSQARQLVGAYVTEPGVRVVEVRTDDDQVHIRLTRTIGLALRPPGWNSRTTIVAEATAQLRTGL